MKLTKEVAKHVRKLEGNEKLIIEHTKDGEYWVTDCLIAVKFGPEEFQDFKEKYESYKNTKEIPEIEKGSSVMCTSFQSSKVKMNDFSDCTTHVTTIIGNEQNMEKVNVTKFYLDNARINIIAELGELQLTQSKYDFVVDNYPIHKAGDKLRALQCYSEQGELKALVMPCRGDCEIVDHMEELEKIAEFL